MNKNAKKQREAVILSKQIVLKTQCLRRCVRVFLKQKTGSRSVPKKKVETLGEVSHSFICYKSVEKRESRNDLILTAKPQI